MPAKYPLVSQGNAPDYINVPLGHGEWLRKLADEIEVPLINRYPEINPTNVGEADTLSLLSRPGLKRWLAVGSGPIQAVYSQPGSFSEALFVVSGENLYRIDQDESITSIGGPVTSDLRNTVYMAATARLGTTPEYLFIAGGGALWLYIEDGYATGLLTGTPANNDVIHMDTVYYKFTTGSVDAGTPAGTLANPWLVHMDISSSAISYGNLYAAVNLTGGGGTNYSTSTTIHPTMQSIASSTGTFKVRALNAGVGGNSLPTTVTSSGMVWGSATLTGGGSPYFDQVETPDALGVACVSYISGFVVVTIAQGNQENGRFYWIEPGEVIIHPLNFATAERSPDPLFSTRVVGDQILMFGPNSTEVWFPNTQATDPSQSFIRTQGVVFDRGIWQGTDAQIRDTVFVVDPTGVVWIIENGQPKRISNSAIEETIREAMRDQLTVINP